MMKSIGGFVLIAVAMALIVPKFIDGFPHEDEAQLNVASHSKTPNSPATAKSFRDSRGHFSFSARLNGQRVNVLVDTGASTVAINQSTAKRIGLRFGNRGTMRVSTANGTISADKAVINEVRIGDIVVRNVNALVLGDRSLNGTLLGMSFLKKLKKFEINGRTLTLVK